MTRTPLPLAAAIGELHDAQDRVEAVYLERWTTMAGRTRRRWISPWQALTWGARFRLAVRRRDDAAERVGILSSLFAPKPAAGVTANHPHALRG